MKQKISPTIVGIFVAGGFLLLVFALISFGSGGLFHKPARFVVILRQSSVSGLEPGSSVKFSGVRVGRVEAVNARIDAGPGEVVVRVTCNIDETNAAALFPPPVPAHDELISRLIANGMSAKINFSGVTGLQYLDLNVVPALRGQKAAVDPETGLVIVPAAPSDFSEFTETLTTILNNVAKVDFPGISSDLKTLLANINAEIAGVDLRGTLERVNAAVDAIQKTAADDNLRQAMARLNKASDELHGLVTDIRADVPEVKADLQNVLAQAAAAMKTLDDAGADVQTLVGPRGGLGDELGRTLDALRAAAQSAEQLSDYLERNPGALLRGRAPEPAPTPPAKP